MSLSIDSSAASFQHLHVGGHRGPPQASPPILSALSPETGSGTQGGSPVSPSSSSSGTATADSDNPDALNLLA